MWLGGGRTVQCQHRLRQPGIELVAGPELAALAGAPAVQLAVAGDGGGVLRAWPPARLSFC